jgi:hypothetical protein
MSKRGESGGGVPAGAPAGEWRRRRLTLAPRPWVGRDQGSQPAKVSSFIFAGLEGNGDGPVAGEAAIGLGTWSNGGCSSVASSSTVREEFERVTNGSRFWVLADDGSETESCLEGELLDVFSAPRSMAMEGPVQSTVRGVSPITVEAPEMVAPRLDSTDCGRVRRNGHPKLMHSRSPTGRPWRGPLPPARISPARSLGDLWGTD